MSMKDPVEKGFNEQINKEMFSAYLYLSMAAWCEEQDLPGFANWMKVQAQEETCHAMILFNHVTERGGRVILEAIEKPDSDFKGIVEVFEATLKHEEFITDSINKLSILAQNEADLAARNRLEWFVEEQVEEEATASGILAEVRRAEGGQGLLMLDREKAARVFTMPSPLVSGE